MPGSSHQRDDKNKPKRDGSSRDNRSRGRTSEGRDQRDTRGPRSSSASNTSSTSSASKDTRETRGDKNSNDSRRGQRVSTRRPRGNDKSKRSDGRIETKSGQRKVREQRGNSRDNRDRGTNSRRGRGRSDNSRQSTTKAFPITGSPVIYCTKTGQKKENPVNSPRDTEDTGKRVNFLSKIGTTVSSIFGRK